MERTVQTIPGLGVDLPELQQARALWQANRFDESLAVFEAAAERHPQNLVALIDASRALGARFEIARAEQIVDRLLKVAGQRADILHLAGQTYRMIFRPEAAMRCFVFYAAFPFGIAKLRLFLLSAKYYLFFFETLW